MRSLLSVDDLTDNAEGLGIDVDRRISAAYSFEGNSIHTRSTFLKALADLSVASDDVWVIPCPPFNISNEVSREVIASPYFAGYEQKAALYQVQKALIWSLLDE